MWKRLATFLLPFVLLQVWGPPFSLDWLRFPLGIAGSLALCTVTVVIEREWSRRAWVVSLRSPRLSCALLVLGLTACLLGGLGWTGVFSSWPFAALMAALQFQLFLLLVHRSVHFSWRRDTPFFLIHGGLWLALLSGSVGVADASEWRAIVRRKAADTEAFDQNGRLHHLPYTLQLQSFEVENHPIEGTPVQYGATLLVNGRPVELAVNSPHAVSWSEELLLMSYQRDELTTQVTSCLLLVVHEPWRYPLLAGILLLLAGVGLLLFKLK